MMKTLEIFRMSGAMSRHAETQQAIVAENIANANTPGYRARGIRPFAESYRADSDPQMIRTRPNHLETALRSAPQWHAEVAKNGSASPNGNTVSLETEMLNGVAAKRQHDRALAIYQSSLSILRATLGRR